MINEKNNDVLITSRIKYFILTEIILVLLISVPLFKAKEGSTAVMISSIIFMWLPVISTLITKKITKDGSRLPIKPYIKRNWKLYLTAAYLPTILIFLGALLYFLVFPNHLDLSLSYIQDLAEQSGQEIALPDISVGLIFLISLGLIIIAPFVIVNHILAFGEEVGWRGFLLPLLVEKYGVIKGIIIDGMLWGAVHAPLVCFGVNYSGNYFLKPHTGILMMIIFATVIGILLSYLTLKTKSIIPACISHGVINAVREAPLFICTSSYNALLGPKPSGIIAMAGFIILGIILLKKLKDEC